jgi:hypothetical protein
VLRQAQILASTVTLASLDYSTAEHAHAALASLITATGSRNNALLAVQTIRPLLIPAPQSGPTSNGHCAWPRAATSPAIAADPAGPDGHAGNGQVLLADPGMLQVTGNGPLIKAAREIVGQARQQGVRLSQTALAGQLRARGFTIANERLRWLAARSGLDADEAPG